MVPYRAMLDVPHEVVEHVSWLIYARRCELNSSWRRLGCFRQALLALVHLRKNETLAQIGAGFGVSTATAGRYLTETVDVLAEHTPSLLDALQVLQECFRVCWWVESLACLWRCCVMWSGGRSGSMIFFATLGAC